MAARANGHALEQVMPVKISFDLDDTIILRETSPLIEPPLPKPAGLLYHERLRLGVVALCARLQDAGWQVCVYTQSVRPKWYIRGLFARYGIPLVLIVNRCEHEKSVQWDKHKEKPKKLPIKFGIDLHVDDDERVSGYGERYGFPVVLLDPRDAGWADKVWQRAEQLAQQK